ncbi:MAG: hypothetical protein IJK81_05915 [Selenomonadaceae bacterium]|nr:hypothetical protein [Selenomonadaceae bacterium]
MITEIMLLLIVLGAGIVFIAWSNTRRRKQDALERREVEDSTGKLKKELERTANEIIGRMENHVTHLETVLDESERNRTQLEGRVSELKKLLKKSEGQSGEIRDLLARLDDAGEEINSMQRKMDVVERKLNLAMTAPLPIQQPVTIPQMTTPLVPPIITPPITSAPFAPINTTSAPPPIEPRNIPPAAQIKPQPIEQKNPPPAQIKPRNAPPTQITTTPAEPINPLGPITVQPIIRPAEVEDKAFDKILEKSIAEPPKPRKSIVLSPENKQPVTVVEADPVKIEATRKKLTEASAKMAENPPEEPGNQAQPLQRRRRSSRSARDVRKAALDAIKAAEQTSATAEKPLEVPRRKPEKEIMPERRDLKLETTNSAIIKEMLLAGMSIEDISRETGLGRGAIELIQEMTRRQLARR